LEDVHQGEDHLCGKEEDSFGEIIIGVVMMMMMMVMIITMV